MLKIVKQKLQAQLGDKGFSEILTGSAFTLFARGGSAGLGLAISLLVARIYGAEVTGILTIVQSFMLMVSIVALLGTKVSILRLIPEHIAKFSVTSAFRVYRKIQYLVAMTAVVIGVLFFFVSDSIAQSVFSKTELSFYIRITALCVVFKALMDLNTEAVRGLRLIRTYAVMQVLPYFFMLMILGAAVFLSGKEGDPVYAQLVSWAVTALVGIAVMDRSFRQRMLPMDIVDNVKVRQLLDISLPMLMTSSMSFVVGQAGILILGISRSSEEVGYYSIAVKLATLTTFILQAINSMAAPKLSELFHTGEMDELFRIAKKSSKLIFWTTLPILILLVLLGKQILYLFGDDFVKAYVPMLVLLSGQFVNSVSGSTGPFMNMTGNQKYFRNIITMASSINLLICFLLIPLVGALGAAISAASSLVLWNVWTLFFIRKKYSKNICYFPI